MGTKFDVGVVQKLLPGFLVTDEGDGVRAYRNQADSYDDSVGVTALMFAAMSLNLDPSQFVDKSRYQTEEWGSEWTGKYQDAGIIYDIKFLYEPTED